MIRGLLLIGVAYVFMRYREYIVRNITGRLDFAEKYLGQGGSFNLFLILSFVCFFWGVAALTGTESFFLSPLQQFFQPGAPAGGASVNDF